jgi:hypothetical protein
MRNGGLNKEFFFFKTTVAGYFILEMTNCSAGKTRLSSSGIYQGHFQSLLLQ